MRRFLALALVLAATVQGLLSRRPPRAGPPPRAPSVASRAARFAIAHPWASLIGVASVVLLGGFAVMLSGVVPIAASSGHWRITELFLHFAMRRSIATHSVTVGTVPDLEDPSLVLRGAGHYEGGCRPCHGGPQGDVPAIPRAMTPHPPALPDRIPGWEADDLFYIVKHGVKFTGMPAWPARERDDEVWAVVAFLRRLPDLELEEYQALVRGTGASIRDLPGGEPVAASTAPEAVRQVCARCHGLDGLGRGTGAFPRLAGQRAEYLSRSLRAYAAGQRHSGIMQPIAESLPATTQQALADYYASLPGLGFVEDAEVDPAARGARIVARGMPPRIPSCQDCHGPRATPTNPAYPQLAGQYPEYLRLQLELLRDGRRGGTEYLRLMRAFVHRLTDEEIDEAVAYYGTRGR